jgi:hypothetical protein
MQDSNNCVNLLKSKRIIFMLILLDVIVNQSWASLPKLIYLAFLDQDLKQLIYFLTLQILILLINHIRVRSFNTINKSKIFYMILKNSKAIIGLKKQILRIKAYYSRTKIWKLDIKAKGFFNNMMDLMYF